MSNPGSAGSAQRGIVFMLLAVVLFTAMDAVVKDLVQRHPVALVVWARFAVQFALVVAVLGRRTFAHLRTAHPGHHALRGLTQVATAGFYFAALPFIGLLEAQALADISPLLITIGAALFLGERLGPRRIIGVAVAMAGALIILRPGWAVFAPAALLPLAAAVTYAANALLTRAMGARESPWTAMLISSAICTALASLALPFVWQPVASTDLPVFLVAGALGTAAQFAIIRAFSLAEASAIAPFGYAGLVTAALWGWLFFGEWPDQPTILGALVIGAAGLYVWHRETVGTKA